MWGLQTFRTRCTASRLKRALSSHSWWSERADWGSQRLSIRYSSRTCIRNESFPMPQVTRTFSQLRSLTWFFLEKSKQTVKLDASTVEIEERGVKLRLTVVDTPGYGDAIDNTDCFKEILRYIDEQFQRFLRDESGLNRRNIVDNRIHCCFYFISPFGHG